eukprot:ctg_502.g251
MRVTPGGSVQRGSGFEWPGGWRLTAASEEEIDYRGRSRAGSSICPLRISVITYSNHGGSPRGAAGTLAGPRCPQRANAASGDGRGERGARVGTGDGAGRGVCGSGAAALDSRGVRGAVPTRGVRADGGDER